MTQGKRYVAKQSMQTNSWFVLDTWTLRHMGYYGDNAKAAKARARTLNSRNGGK
jgi:hypothetical protein